MGISDILNFNFFLQYKSAKKIITKNDDKEPEE